MPRVNWGLLIVVVLVLGGLAVATGNSGDGGDGSDVCASVPRSALDSIEDGLTVNGTLSGGQAVRSGDWWFVAAEIDANGLEDSGDVGVWAMSESAYRGNSGLILMADGFAREFSQWGTQTGSENYGVWQVQAVREAMDCEG